MVTLLPPSRDVIFLPLEFGLKFTKGSKFVYQKNISIPAAWSCPLRVTASHLHHHSKDTQFMLSFFLLISSRNFSSLSSLLSSMLQICEGCQKTVKLTWYCKSLKNGNNDYHFHFFHHHHHHHNHNYCHYDYFNSHNIFFSIFPNNIFSIYH